MKTRKAFYRALRSVANKFTWEIRSDGMIEGKKIGDPENYTCAITAVYNSRNKESVSAFSYRSAGIDLGLPMDEVETIVSAFDNNTWQERFNPRVRKALLSAVGLDNQTKV